MKKFLLVVMILFVALYGISFAEGSYFSTDYNGSFGAGYWMPSITGSLQTSLPNAAAIDFKNDLGLNNNGTVYADFRYKFDETSSLYLDYFNITNSGSLTLPNTFSWHNVAYNAGNLVNSSLNVRMLDVIYEKKIYENDQAYLCGTIGAKYGQAAITVNNITRGSTGRSSAIGLIPEIGLFGKTKMTQNLNGIARINAMVGDNSGQHVGMIDINAGITWDFYQSWAADLGYKWFQLTGKNLSSNNQMNINYGGPFVMFRYSY